MIIAEYENTLYWTDSMVEESYISYMLNNLIREPFGDGRANHLSGIRFYCGEEPLVLEAGVTWEEVE